MKFVTLKTFNKKKLLIPTLIITSIILIITLFISHAEFISTDHVTIVDGVINYTPYDFKMMAMYEQKDNCEDTSSDTCYTEIDVMPSEGYEINQEKSHCFINNDGEHVIKELVKNTKCILYFNKKKGKNLLNTLVSNICQNTNNEEEVKNCLVNKNGYRYQGNNPNNYVTFNDEEWRIVGIFDIDSNDDSNQLIKIVKSTSIGDLQYFKSNFTTWDETSLHNTLNENYLNSQGDYGTTGIKEKYHNMLAHAKWNIGEVNYYGTLGEAYTTEKYEVSQNNYIGILSVSDIGYTDFNALDSINIENGSHTSWLNTKQWLINKAVDSPPSSPTLTNSKNNNNKYKVQLLAGLDLPPGDGEPVFYNNGSYFDYYLSETSFLIYPSLYLKSTVTFETASNDDIGSQTNPYIIK